MLRLKWRKKKKTIFAWVLLGSAALATLLMSSLLVSGEEKLHHSDENLRLLKQARKDGIVVLVMETSYDVEKRDLRRSGIASTWGSSPLFLKVLFSADHCAQDLPKTICMVKAFNTLTMAFRKKMRFLLKVDDVTFVIPWKVVELTRKLDPWKPVAFGSRLFVNDETAFLSGGAGILISRALLRAFLEEWKSKCSVKMRERFHLRSEDVSFSTCAASIPGANLINHVGFHVFEPLTVLSENFPNWYRTYKKDESSEIRRAITFHNVEQPLCFHLWNCLNAQDCSASRWPVHGIGGYAMNPRAHAMEVNEFLNMLESLWKT